MTRTAIIYGALLALLMGASWHEWTKEPEPDTDGKVVVLQGEAEDIEKIVWKTDKEEATLVRKSDDRGEYVWVDYTRWVQKPKKHDEPKPEDAKDGEPKPEDVQGEATEEPKPDGAQDEVAEEAKEEAKPGESAEEELEARHQVFKSGEAGTELFNAFSPLLAIRKLGQVEGDKLATIGLAEPEGTLTVVRKGRTRSFDLGGEAYGTKDRYLRDSESGEIYLVDDEALKPLKHARTRLPDRTLFSIEKEKVASATITGSSASLDVIQKNREDKAKATWVRKSSPDEAAEQVNTWLDKALKMKGSSYASPDEPPTDLRERFKLTLVDDHGLAETLVISQDGEDGDWYGSSEHTRGQIKLLRSTTSQLFEDVDSMIEG